MLHILNNWPKNAQGRFICTKDRPKPPYTKDTKWEHDDVHETDKDSDYYIEYKCNSCGYVWTTEMPD